MNQTYDNDEIDRIFFRDDEILPSSGFAISVMDAVRREASAPPPIPFPWMRALPGLAAGMFTIVILIVGIVGAGRLSPASDLSASLPSTRILHQGNIESAVVWTVMALLVALVSVMASMRLGGTRA